MLIQCHLKCFKCWIQESYYDVADILGEGELHRVLARKQKKCRRRQEVILYFMFGLRRYSTEENSFARMDEALRMDFVCFFHSGQSRCCWLESFKPLQSLFYSLLLLVSLCYQKLSAYRSQTVKHLVELFGHQTSDFHLKSDL